MEAQTKYFPEMAEVILEWLNHEFPDWSSHEYKGTAHFLLIKTIDPPEFALRPRGARITLTLRQDTVRISHGFKFQADPILKKHNMNPMLIMYYSDPNLFPTITEHIQFANKYLR